MKYLFSVLLLVFTATINLSCNSKKVEDNPMTIEPEDTVTVIDKGIDTLTIELDKSAERIESEVMTVEQELENL